MKLQITTSRFSAISKLGIGALLALLGFNNNGGFADQSQQGALIDLAFLYGPLLIALFGLAIAAQGAIDYSYRRTVTFKDGQVSVSGKSFLKSENWCEPLIAFEGVRWREIMVQNRRRMSRDNTHNRAPHIYQVLELQPRNKNLCIPQHVTMVKAGSEKFFQQMSEMIDIKNEIRVPCASPVRN